jgi:hypothetical protein
MTLEDLKALYDKERDYQRHAFGKEYSDMKELNPASFLLFLERYVTQARDDYVGQWKRDLPLWLNTCHEYEEAGIAPVHFYSSVIKIFALAGALLETYANIDASNWRKNPDEDAKKWKTENAKEGD